MSYEMINKKQKKTSVETNQQYSLIQTGGSDLEENLQQIMQAKKF